MNVLQAIQYIIQSWNEIIAYTIENYWNHVKILSADNIEDDIYEDDDLMLDDELSKAIEALNLPNIMQVKEFLIIPEEDIVYEISDISEFTNMFKNKSTSNLDEVDDSIETKIIHINEAL